MIERHVTYDVHSGQQDAFERFIREEYAPTMSRAPGLVRVTLLREQEAPTLYHMVIAFESPEKAAEWRASEAHKALGATLKGFLLQSQVATYQVVAQRP